MITPPHTVAEIAQWLASEFSQPMRQNPFLDLLKTKVVVFDGGMGTQIFARNLTLADFWDKENCTDVLVLSRPDVITDIHADYYAAGADIVETDTFGASPLVLAEFGLADRCFELNVQAVQLARNAAARFTDGKPRFVAGSMGPGTKSPTLGQISFEAMHASYYEQARGLLTGGVDVLLVETCFDLLQAKIATIACLDAMRELRRRVPLMVQVTMETTGTMLLGTEMTSAITTLEALPIDVLGMNCATGPELMRGHVEVLHQQSTRYTSVQPNAGLPVLHDGQTHFPLTPAELAKAHVEFVQRFGVSIVGGCCGTTPAHIRAVADAVATLKPAPRPLLHAVLTPAQASISCLYGTVSARQELSLLNVGERTNTNGSKKFREAMLAGDWDTLVTMGKEQVREGAHCVDVCVDYVGRDGVPDMRAVVTRFAKEVALPLMIDSTQLDVIEAGLQCCPGKAIVNSINLEDGEEKLAQMAVLLRRYGAAVVAGTIDEDKEEAMAKTADRKVAVAQRLYDLLVNKYGVPPSDIYFDPLIFPIVTGQDEVRQLALETISGIRRIHEALSLCHTTLGLSNVSFGLKPYARMVLNSAFYQECVAAGLTSAIVHASKILPKNKIDPEHYQWALDLIYDRSRADYHPLGLLSTLGAPARDESATIANLPLEERLRRHIIDGEKQHLTAHLQEAMTRYAPLDIINNHLLEGMKTVGELFGSGQMQLPFVLQSAEVMKAAVAYLETFMEKKASSTRGTLVLATVKGDVHDIGKNLVDIILSNNGYKVINLGIKQPIEQIVTAWREHQADAIGLSGLLVKSTLVMRDNLLELNRQGITVPVILGGAALTRGYVQKDLRAQYQGTLFYGKDAFEGLKAMDYITTGRAADLVTETNRVSDEQDAKRCPAGVVTAPTASKIINTTRSSDIFPDAAIPALPFYGSRVVDNIAVDAVWPYMDEIALFRGQWQLNRGNKERDDYREWLEATARPIYNRIKAQCRELNILRPRLVYGYFPCQSEGNDLIIYQDDAKTERLRFTFPRQSDRKLWCLADFFAAKATGRMDVVAFQCVTVGEEISRHEKKLFDNNDFTEYLYMHGIGVQTAEALAEMWHKRIRQELGIAIEDGPDMRDLFACRYLGCRYSFGYPACPDLSDEVKLFALLDPARIGCTLSENWQIVPEQATSALIAHHAQAKYFNAD